MMTVHMIGNAHLDPVWLWRRADGVDTALATARSACDRLDEYADFVFTCSTRWFHEQVERLDAELFERVRRFVEAGRWQLVGGMVVQPDCNLPSAESFARHFLSGQAYYREKFGRATTVGYNVDSFGHTAYMPRFLCDAGIDSYVFMRPGPHEMALPSRLFRWRSPDGREVTAFRIAGAYTTHGADVREHVERSLADLPAGVQETMCFLGVGDHGGGPTKAQIEWIIEHADAVDGAKLVFSHPRAFFDAAAHADALPTVEGELQHHAIGCYSVERRIKVAMRRAEARLQQAERTVEALADAAPPAAGPAIDAAWEKVLFNQFHDILGGTCLDAESRRASVEMLAAESAAERIITTATRRAFRSAAEPGVHKVVAFNPSAEPFDGWLEHEPWLAFRGEGRGLTLRDEEGREVPFQLVESASMAGVRRILFRLAVGPAGSRVLRVEPSGDAAGLAAGPTELSVDEAGALANEHVAVLADDDGIAANGWRIALEVCGDPTDTWSHSAGSRFEGERLGSVAWSGDCDVVESGPLRAALRLRGQFGSSRAWCRLMLCRGEALLRLRLSVVWADVRRRLRLRLTGPAEVTARTDLVSGGPLRRAIDGREYPLAGGMVVETPAGALGVAAPEVFSGSVDPAGVSLTLLRSPYAAHHDPADADSHPDQPVTDQGAHEFDLWVCPGCGADIGMVETLARHLPAPPIVWDLTG